MPGAVLQRTEYIRVFHALRENGGYTPSLSGHIVAKGGLAEGLVFTDLDLI